MGKKTLTKKLSLNKETFKHLSAPQLGAVAGGIPSFNSVCANCQDSSSIKDSLCNGCHGSDNCH